jgi:hypothetical protein
MSIVNYAIEGAALVLSPLSAYLVFRYLKDHVKVLHEDMRKLITDSATVIRKTVCDTNDELGKKVKETKQFLSDTSQKDHGDTRVFVQKAHEEAKAAVVDLHKVSNELLSSAAEEIKSTVNKTSAILHKSFVDSVASVEAKTAQATRERLDRPTPEVQCTKCGCNVVRYNEHNVCANCW